MANTNIPLGTYVSDGVRSGPFYTGQLPRNFIADANGVLTSSSHDNYGPGVLFSPQNTYSLVPYPAGVANVVALTQAGTIPQATNLTLLGDNAATTLINGVVQLDWPRVITVTIAGADANPGTNVIIFGTDWYGMPLQHTYTVQAQQNYPLAVLPTINANPGTIVPAAKAFYTVNRVWISAGLPQGCRISVGASNIFGLPYLVKNFGSVTSIGWDGVSDLTVFVVEESIAPKGILIGADLTFPATAATGDVRGLYLPSSVADGVKRLLFTSYIEGADVWQNQLANIQQLQAVNQQPVIGVPTAPLTPADLYGVPQFYTGNTGNV